MRENAVMGLMPDWDGLRRNRNRPEGRPAMLQTWHDLVFLHSKVSRHVLQRLVPSELTVEEFDGSGWLGFVPFWMSGIRKPLLPPMPWLSRFHETNIRTYVTHPKYGPGVWFFSLEAARYIACLYARQAFKLPYFHSRLSGRIEGETRRYQGKRNRTQMMSDLGIFTANLQSYSLSVARDGHWFKAQPESFEYWLVERYRLYSVARNDQVMTAQVYHQPYEIAKGRVSDFQLHGLDSQFGQLDFTSVLLAKTLRVECFAPKAI